MTSVFAPRPRPPVALATVTPEVEAAVAAWRDACRTRDVMWTEYLRHSDEHRRRQLAAHDVGKRVRRSRAFQLATGRYENADYSASRALMEIEMRLRVANPGVDNRSIMATKRELTRPVIDQ